MRIPFKSIRYRRREPVEMGIIFERRVSRLSEHGTYPPLAAAQGMNFLTQTRTLLFTDIKHYTLLEILPAATYSGNSALEKGALRSEKGEADLSLTAKYGLTSQLIMDGTVNPDFSQVESDAGQVDFNLRYSLYYPEKRAFFFEGQEKFFFAANQAGDPLGAVIYTRSIVDPVFGFKLNGKITPGDTIASIYAMDELPASAAEDFAHFTIVRYKHALREDGHLGGFWTGRFEAGHYNIVAGTDGQIRLTPSSMFGFHGLLSQSKPGAAVAAFDGHALGFQYQYMTRDWLIYAALQDLSEDFETEVGYLTRNGLTRLQMEIVPRLYPQSKTILRIDPTFLSTQIRDRFSGLYETDDSFDLRFTLPRNTSLSAGGKYATEVYLGRKFGRSSLRFSGSSLITNKLTLTGSYRYGDKIRYVDDPYQGRGADALLAATYFPTENLHFQLSVTYSDFTRSADGLKEFDYSIVRSLNTYQFNKYLFIRAIIEYNSFRERLMTDFLASFTYIPGTVVHIGYGSLYEKIAWRDGDYVSADRFLESKRGFFFKASYLWRL